MKQIYLVLFLLLLTTRSFAQQFDANEHPCAGETYYYALQSYGTTTTHFVFEMDSKFGYIIQGTNHVNKTGYINFPGVQVVWKAGTVRGTLTVTRYKQVVQYDVDGTFLGYDYVKVGTSTQLLSRVDGLTGVKIINTSISAKTSSDLGYGARTITVNASPALNSPISSYSWGALPTGMTYVGGVPTGAIATIALDGCASGNIKVKGYNSQCGTWSAEVSVPISRPKPTIVAQNVSCTGGTYSLSYLPASATVSWQVSNTSIATVSVSNNTAVVSRVGSQNGEVTLAAKISLSCGLVETAPVNIKIGQPSTPSYSIQIFQSNNGSICVNSRGNIFSVEPQSFDPGVYFEWGYIKLYGNKPPVVVNSLGSVYQDFIFNETGTYQIYARAKNACGYGLSNMVTRNVNVVLCSGGGGLPEPLSVTTYPNPSNDILVIESDQKLNSESPVTEVKLFDSKGILRKQGKTNHGKLNLNTADLLEGIYYLHTSNGKNTNKKQIIIKR